MPDMSKTLVRSLCAAALLVAGAGLYAAPQEPQKLSMPGYPAAGTPPMVKLVAPGAEPRSPLRFKVAAGQKETLLMTMNMGVNLSMEGMSMPAMEMPIFKMWADAAVSGVAPSGDITFEIAFTKLVVEPGPGGDAAMAQMVQAAAGEITKLKGSTTMTSRGINKSSAVDVNAITDPAMRQTLSSMSSQFESLSMPMPEEPVGVGAKWEVRQAIQSAGATLFQRVECELTALTATSATIKVTTEQTAPPQTVSNPAMPGMLMNIEKVSGGGTGTMNLQFANLMPSSEMTTSTTMNVAVDMGGQTQRMAVQTNIKVSVAPEKK